ncbi:right-handed parallel beta-helix repeat-containing protein [Antarctobacter sp.]|uniref:right-handed parallel beta-helix repeat-containing protein n=1 Tax=Antarctobacter sp. TaxID=1872577 RepID=UPI002B277E30|nr:right-handed parallel beta-helix repeat-containing protein [Antarctobacter sp.]
MIRKIMLFSGLLALFGAPLKAFTQCDFGFEVNNESSALQSLIDGAQDLGGFWRPIRQAPDDVQEIGRFIARLDICLVTPDGKPRTIRIGGGSQEIPSPYVTTCTAALLPGNRLLANRHCFYEPALVKAGFTFVQEARANFGYVSEDFTDNVQTFLVANRELAQDEGTDALVLQIVGADANERLGGHIPMLMETRATPRRALTMIHHPLRQPQRFSAGTCQIHPTQDELPPEAAELRHSCETGGGSSGALLLDARTLAVVGLHNRGGLTARGGHNGGHKIAAVEAALGLGFEEVRSPEPKVDPEAEARLALTAALLIRALDGRAAALAQVERDHAGTRGATLAARERADLHEDRANAALDAAERLSDPRQQKTALEQVARDFVQTRAADRAQRMLVFLQPKGPSRDDQAMASLLAALRAPDDAAQRPLLEAILKDFSGTSAAKSAEAMLAKMAVATKPVAKTVARPVAVPKQPTARASDTEKSATAALGRALAMSDPDMQRRALSMVQERYPGTNAAKRARAAVAKLTTSGTAVVNGATKANARAALARALAMFDPDMQRRALSMVQERYPGTDAAKKARAAVAAVPTLSVKQDGSGDFRTIAEAVKAAKPGTRIEIFPGTYNGGVRVGKELEIVGVGDRDKIIWQAKSADVIEWVAPKGRIANLSLRQLGESSYAVRFGAGSALLEHCDLTSSGGPSKGAPIVGIFNRANPVLRDNVIHDGKSIGVFVAFKGRGTLERNKIYGNKNAQVSVTLEGDPVLRNNVIGPSPTIAVFVNKGGKGTIIANDLRGNKAGAFSIGRDAGKVIRRDNKE